MKNNDTKKVSAFILTKNNEEQIRDALECVKWVDEIVIIDGFSSDKTLNICKEYGCRIYQKNFEGFDKERNFAINKCSHGWIFEIDSDEIIDDALKKSILNAVKSNEYDAYYIRRRDYFLKKPLVDLKLIRLYKKGVLHYVGTTHETVVFDKKIKLGMLKGYGFHNANDTSAIFQTINKWDVETEREIISLKRFGKKRMGKLKLLYRMFVYPIIHFFGLLIYKMFLFKGLRAIIWAVCAAFYEFIIYAKYYEVYYFKVRKINPQKACLLPLQQTTTKKTRK